MEYKTKLKSSLCWPNLKYMLLKKEKKRYIWLKVVGV